MFGQEFDQGNCPDKVEKLNKDQLARKKTSIKFDRDDNMI